MSIKKKKEEKVQKTIVMHVHVLCLVFVQFRCTVHTQVLYIYSCLYRCASVLHVQYTCSIEL